MRGSCGPLDRRQPSGEAETITQHQIQRMEMEGWTERRGREGRSEGGRSGSGTKERGGEKGGGRDKETGSGGAAELKKERKKRGGDERRWTER